MATATKPAQAIEPVFITINYRKGSNLSFTVPLTEIVRIRSDNVYCHIDLVRGKSITVCCFLKDIEALAVDGLLRVNKYVMIPKHQILGIKLIPIPKNCEKRNYRLEVVTQVDSIIIADRRKQQIMTLFGVSIPELRKARRRFIKVSKLH